MHSVLVAPTSQRSGADDARVAAATPTPYILDSNLILREFVRRRQTGTTVVYIHSGDQVLENDQIFQSDHFRRRIVSLLYGL